MRDATPRGMARGTTGRWLTEARARVAETANRIYERGLTCAAGGNISARAGDRVVITPAGRSLRMVDRRDLSVIDLEGRHLDGPPPSSERLLHLAVYRRRPDVAFVVHAHAPYAIAVSCLPPRDDGAAMPAYTGGYAIMIGRLPLVPHYIPSTPGLAEAAADALAETDAALLANHGTVAVGRDPEGPFQLTELIEENALVHVTVGDRARALDDEEIEECRRLYRKPPAPVFRPR
ncbi:MAG TPA: class II aldolase/adducin family protein [Thermodesulfobacteriota bacterium]